MNKSNLIRNTVLQKLQVDENFEGVIAAEIDGNYFSAADIAMQDNEGNCEVYRLIIIKSND